MTYTEQGDEVILQMRLVDMATLNWLLTRVVGALVGASCYDSARTAAIFANELNGAGTANANPNWTPFLIGPPMGNEAMPGVDA